MEENFITSKRVFFRSNRACRPAHCMKAAGLFLLFLSFYINALAQHTITGTVTGGEGPLIGVTVSLKRDSKIGVLTDVNGRFSIKADPTDSLLFSYIGMEPQTVPV